MNGVGFVVNPRHLYMFSMGDEKQVKCLDMAIVKDVPFTNICFHWAILKKVPCINNFTLVLGH
jgi:hypothetical protein